MNWSTSFARSRMIRRASLRCGSLSASRKMSSPVSSSTTGAPVSSFSIRAMPMNIAFGRLMTCGRTSSFANAASRRSSFTCAPSSPFRMLMKNAPIFDGGVCAPRRPAMFNIHGRSNSQSTTRGVCRNTDDAY